MDVATLLKIQGSQTRGLWADCGPPETFVWPANISKTDQI